MNLTYKNLIDIKSYKEIEKTDNVNYALANGKLSVEMTDGTYGYLVFKVKSAKANAIAVESRKNELEINFYYQIKNDYEKSIILQKSAAETKVAVEQLSNLKYLGKALESGEITMLDYIVEVQMYYEARTMALEAERAYYMSLAKLSAYTL